MQYNSHTTVYKLKPHGRSWEAAMKMAAHLRKTLNQRTGVPNDTFDAEDLTENFYRTLCNDFVDDQGTLRVLGIGSPAIVVKTYHDGAPRAYLHYPKLYIDKSRGWGNPSFYVLATESYDGSITAPVDSELYDDRVMANEDLMDSGPEPELVPVLALSPRGCDMPENFDPHKHFSMMSDTSDNLHKVSFIAAGDSLALLKSYQTRCKQYSKICNDICRTISKTITDIFEDAFKGNIELAFEYMPHVHWTPPLEPNDPPSFWLRVSTPCNDSIDLESNYHLRLTANGSEYLVTPSVNTEGRPLRSLFDDIPPQPQLSEYVGLSIYSDADPSRLIVPYITELHIQGNEISLLTYNTDGSGQFSFAPDGAIPFNAALYAWLIEDLKDGINGIEVPTMPQGLQEIFKALPLRPNVQPDTITQTLTR